MTTRNATMTVTHLSVVAVAATNIQPSLKGSCARYRAICDKWIEFSHQSAAIAAVAGA